MRTATMWSRAFLPEALTAFVLLMAASLASFAEFPQPPRVALKGHDPVAYFTLGKPAAGVPSISYDWDDSRYYFMNTKHRDMFAANPERYAPRFAGWCAGAMAYGARTEADPRIWTIVDGKLYLFRSQEGKREVQADPRALAAADKAWVTLR